MARMTRADELLIESIYQEILGTFDPSVKLDSEFIKTIFEFEFHGEAIRRLKIVSGYSGEEASEILNEFKQTNAMYIMEQL